MLLTHTSGEPTDVNLGPMGPGGPKSGRHPARAHYASAIGPGEVFRYSDINYILLGAIVEKLSGERDVYAQGNIFAPLGMAKPATFRRPKHVALI